MFVGSVPAKARSYFGTLLKGRKDKVFVSCSGNFTIDRIAAEMGNRVYSNDVSLYSRTIADILLGRESKFECVNETYKQIFDTWPPHKFRPIVEIMFVVYGSQWEQQKNDYQRLQWTNLMKYHQAFFSNTIAKLSRTGALAFKIEDFYYGDFLEHVRNSDGINFLFAPTYKNGYEKMYKRVDDVFNYEHAQYAVFDSKKAAPIYKQMLEEKPAVIYSDTIWEELRGFITAKIKLGGSKKDIIVYSNIADEKRYITAPQEFEKPRYHLLEAGYKLGPETRIDIVPCKVQHVNYYKQLFMSAKVDYSTGGDMGMLFLADNKIFGFATFSSTLGTKDPFKILFLQSDFTAHSDTKRLSKLLISLLTSADVQTLLMKKYCHVFDGLQTSVYTNKPVSMKYRGIFSLEERLNEKLVYLSQFCTKNAAQLYGEWLKKNQAEVV